MFKEMGSLMGLMGKLPKIKEEIDKLQQRLAQATVEGQAGGGMVTVKMTGKFAVQSCTITDEALKDRELLEDLIAAATNQAVEKAKQLMAEESQKLAAEIGLPPGLGIPGLT
jgi:DNA-binding YbaB/EbfC family protein